MARIFKTKRKYENDEEYDDSKSGKKRLRKINEVSPKKSKNNMKILESNFDKL